MSFEEVRKPDIGLIAEEFLGWDGEHLCISKSVKQSPSEGERRGVDLAYGQSLRA